MSNSDDLFAPAQPSSGKPASEPSRPAPRPQPSQRRTAAPMVQESDGGYSAADIEVLEGLEPVRRRPGMYIGGTDAKALHHLFAEVLDNSMDEAVAGHASRIEIYLDTDGSISVSDNGRGIPVDPHPRFPDRSALEVIMTTLHAGGKFGSKAYEASGGLHGVGVSVVNALSTRLDVEVARGRRLYKQSFERGLPVGQIEDCGEVMNRRGTTVRFWPDPEIFGTAIHFDAARVLRMARAKAYLFAGVEIRWACAPELARDDVPAEAVFRFPGGLSDYLEERLKGERRVVETVFSGRTGTSGKHGSVEWAVGFVLFDGFTQSYCNTVPTPEGGTHEQGLRAALLKGLKAHAERIGQKKAAQVTGDDLMGLVAGMLSVFVREPEFVGQTKDKLASNEAVKIVEQAVRDAFDHFLAEDPGRASQILEAAIDRADERLKRKQERDVQRRSATRKLRLPGKLADCTANQAEGTEIFIVEGDSAGGSAKQARARATQAVLPLRGKILNVASAGRDKLAQNQQLADLMLALGCSTRSAFRLEDLRYERIIIMTDADVDGAHIASLLITFFYRETPGLVRSGRLYLAAPPLYRMTQGSKTLYARDDAHREELLRTEFDANKKIETGRFKGLGEMLPGQLKETTMDPKTRTLLRVVVAEEADETSETVDRLMGNKAEARFAFIQEHAAFADLEALDV
ncbi:DNA topoisomerase IV subunit B [Amorphus orientalis]|uniref:DNA topoisomerase 4 subunit B n=1 Tax=Amorphus orientalis TaxID=649198 RepID=A0AAE3VP12_9HYPH|nr:DNA topoisomerase IV subunit B [Amorphus orientalis]MDQ0315571.1 topoisomerase-4 subunit B [Amorphus orientalis]